ncbi:hypothetical protein LCGC14_2499250 [marine sediment metagenome]|uniref:Uncharacterized protein n=1 Tax=marine sediment metagenome TaxID=412755 RepID=A0A0F9BQE3_9ZZZZ
MTHHRPARRARRFLRCQRGSVAIEGILVLPMLAWALLACFSFFDGLRQANVNIKAAHTIGDMLSREAAQIDLSYMLGAEGLLNFLVAGSDPVRLRVTVVTFSSSDDRFQISWSYATQGAAIITETTLPDLLPHLPLATGGDQLIVVETAVDYSPLFTMGLGKTTLTNTIVTRPRFAPRLTWSGPPALGV